MLTKAKINKIAIGRKICDGNGVYFKKTAQNKGQWSYRYIIGYRNREIGLGSFPTVKPVDAQRKAETYRQMRADGKDPMVERQRLKLEQYRSEQLRFSELTKEYLTINSINWKNPKSIQAWQNTLATYAYPKLDAIPFGQIDKERVLNVLLPIWKTKHVTARRVAQRMKKIFDYAKSRGYWEGDNPADWDGHLQYVLPRNFNRRIKHHSAMLYQDIPNLFIQLQDHDCLSSTALQFTILTASRTKEVIMATRDEFDFKKRLWSLPAYRMKSNKDHIVPLSDQCLKLLEDLFKKHNQNYIFPSYGQSGHLSNNAMRKFFIEDLNYAPLTVHGFRSSFRVWAAEQNNYDRLAVEFSLAHQLKDSVEAAYLRSNLIEKRKILMQDWADYCFG